MWGIFQPDLWQKLGKFLKYIRLLGISIYDPHTPLWPQKDNCVLGFHIGAKFTILDISYKGFYASMCNPCTCFIIDVIVKKKSFLYLIYPFLIIMIIVYDKYTMIIVYVSIQLNTTFCQTSSMVQTCCDSAQAGIQNNFTNHWPRHI